MTCYGLNIGCIDGVTDFVCETWDKTMLKYFLNKLDHEGSCVSLTVTTDDGEEYVLYDKQAYDEIEALS